MKKVRCRVLPFLAMVLVGCASSPAELRTYPFDRIPADFLSAYPSGTQVRRPKDIQRTFEAAASTLKDICRMGRQVDPANPKIELAVAVRSDGVVEAVGLIKSTFKNADVAQMMMFATGKLDFGKANGEGLYVFYYPIQCV